MSEHRAAVFTDHKGDSFFYGEKGYKKKTEITVRPFDVELRVTAFRAGARIFVQLYCFWLHSSDKEKHVPGLELKAQ